MPPKGSTRRRDDGYADSSSSAGRKRAADSYLDSSTSAKRKRDDGNNNGNNVEYSTQVDFIALTSEQLHAYLTKHELVPLIYPSPSSSLNPPPPSHLTDPPAWITARDENSPTPPLTSTGGITLINRPRRDFKLSVSGSTKDRRRSARLLEDESGWRDMRKPVLVDIEEAHQALAVIAERHFDRQSLREKAENDMITQFLFACRTQGKWISVPRRHSGRNISSPWQIVVLKYTLNNNGME